MPNVGVAQSRRSDRAPITSGLPGKPTIPKPLAFGFVQGTKSLRDSPLRG